MEVAFVHRNAIEKSVKRVMQYKLHTFNLLGNELAFFVTCSKKRTRLLFFLLYVWASFPNQGVIDLFMAFAILLYLFSFSLIPTAPVIAHHK